MARIKDIAKLAKVSPSTVSNVIHKRANKVSPEIYARVEKILEEENYVTHMGARMLSKKGSKLIALILAYKRIEKESIVEDPFVSSVVGAVQLALQNAGYFLLLYSNPDMDECARISKEWNVEGIILLGAKREGYYKIREFLSVPVVSIDTPFSKDDRSYVNVGLEDFNAAKEMTRYLLSMGHQKIAFFSLTEGGDLLERRYIDSERYAGYKEAMEEAKLSAGLWHNLSFTEVERKKQYLSFYEEKFFQATALFVTADIMALELIRFCEDRGIKIPEDLSIVGFDGIKIGKVLHPMLTTMEQDSAEKGRRAVKELLSLIRGEEFLSPCEEWKKGSEQGCGNRKYNDREDNDREDNDREDNDGEYSVSEHICKNIRLPAKLFIGETVSKLE